MTVGKAQYDWKARADKAVRERERKRGERTKNKLTWLERLEIEKLYYKSCLVTEEPTV